MKKYISMLLCLVLLLCTATMPVYATETNELDNGVVDSIAYTDITSDMMELFEEQNITVDPNSIVEVIEVQSGTESVNGLRVTNETSDGIEKNSLFAISTENENSRSIDSSAKATDIVTRNLSRNGTQPWNFNTEKGVIVKCTAYYTLYTSSLTIPKYGVRPQRITFYYTNSGTSTVSKIFVRYGCAGFTYTYPGWEQITSDGTLVCNIDKTQNNPVAGTTYSKTGGIAGGKVICPYLGEYLVCGHYISCQATVGGNLIPGSFSF